MRNTIVSRSGKLLLSVMAVTVLIASILMVSTFAAPAVGTGSTATAAQGDTAAIYVTGAVASEQVTTLVYLTDPTDANIIYIDQTAADANGEATFTFKVPAAAADGAYTVLVGSESSNIAGTGSIVVGGGEDPVIGYEYYVYDDYGIMDTLIDENYDPIDTVATPYVYFALTLDENNGEVAVFIGDTEIKYSPERQKYAGLIPASNFDSNMVPVGLTVADQVPTTFVYGNADSDEYGDVDVTDQFLLSYYIKTGVSYLVDPVAADAYLDAAIDTTDNFIIEYYRKLADKLPVDDYEFDEGKVHVPTIAN